MTEMDEGRSETKGDSASTDPGSHDAERRMEEQLARAASLGTPLLTVIAALAVGWIQGPGPALLVLTGGTLVGVVMLLWSSLRTLVGDAPLPGDLVEASTLGRLRASDLGERKRMVLRSIKDLEHEHAVGKLDDADFRQLHGELRAEAKRILQEMDHSLEGPREKAELLIQKHLRRKGLLAKAGAAPEPTVDGPEKSSEREGDGNLSRRPCPACATNNDADALFCKGCGARLGEAAPNGP